MAGGAYKLSYIVSLEMTLNERIGVLLWHNFKVFVFLRIPKGGMGGGCFSPLSTLPKSATDVCVYGGAPSSYRLAFCVTPVLLTKIDNK